MTRTAGEVDSTSLVLGRFVWSGEGEWERLGLALDGKGVPNSRRGNRRSRPVGISRMRESHNGAFAKSVMESSSGDTSIKSSSGKLMVADAGNRVRKAE